MEVSYEDKIYRQIEKNLANNINDKLYVPIEMIDMSTYKENKNKHTDPVPYKEDIKGEDPLVINNSNSSKDMLENQINVDGYSQEGARLSRAEYIRQAREACLRQLSAMDTSARAINYNIGEEELNNPLIGKKKRDKVTKLFQEGSLEEDIPDEVASYRSLILRTVFAAVIFLSIFIIDKVKVNWGGFSHEAIKDYITANNQLKVLEEIIVSWLK